MIYSSFMADPEKQRFNLEAIKEAARHIPVVSMILEEKIPTPGNVKAVVEQIKDGTHPKAPLIDFLTRMGHKVHIGPAVGKNIVAHVETNPKKDRRYKKGSLIFALAAAGGVVGVYELVRWSRKHARRAQQEKNNKTEKNPTK